MKPIYRFLAVISIVFILLVGAASPGSSASWQGKVDPLLLDTSLQGDTEFLVSLTNQADLGAAKTFTAKSEKGWYVYQTLSSLANRTQAPLIAELNRLGVQYRRYWVVNMLWVRGNSNIIPLLAQRQDVGHIYANLSIAMDAPIQDASPNALPQGIEWNITKVQADDVWALGYTGQGVVIGGADTGYEWDHPAIKIQYRGWSGIQVNHDYNWFDATLEDSPVPVDPYGHGTHTMGIMVGDDGGTHQIGMAPGSRWIGCRNMDSGGNGTPASYIACYQWFIAPTRVDGSQPNPDMAPDVINNSWYCSVSEGCSPDDPDILLVAVKNLVAAGIVSATSAGNAGSACSTVNAPAAIYDESFSVGATNSSDTIASFSSRGPVTVDGSNRLKPDISAPGVNIFSSIPGGDYSYMSGTSMAGPHVAGLVALLISAQPALRGQVAEIESTIEHNSYPIPSTACNSSGTPNNTYGWGRIDALSAVQAVHRIELEKVASAPSILPGGLITYTLTITHHHEVSPTTNVVLTDTIPVGTTFVSATSPYTQTGDTVLWGFPSLGAMQTKSVELAVRADATATGTIVNDDYTVRSDQVALIRGAPVTTLLGWTYFYPMVVNNP